MDGGHDGVTLGCQVLRGVEVVKGNSSFLSHPLYLQPCSHSLYLQPCLVPPKELPSTPPPSAHHPMLTLSVETTRFAANASSPVVGSSKNNSDGDPMSSQPMLSRFFSPPLRPRVLLSPTRVSSALARPSVATRRCT